MNQQKIGKFIQERRKNKNLTQVELAEKLGVSNRTISKWENGNSIPDYSIFNDLCKELDISINELLSGEKLTQENYQEKLEKNIVDTIDYNNKMRNKKIKKLVLIIISFLIIYILYKFFIIFYFNNKNSYQEDKNSFPYNKEIYTLKIKNNGLANNKFDSNWLNIYIPKEFKPVTDKAKSDLVLDDCNLYMKNLEEKNEFDSAILICQRYNENIYNLDSYGISSNLFPYLDPYKIIEKYQIEDTIDLIKYHEKHYNDNVNLFTNLNKIKMNYIAKKFTNNTLPSYKRFFYLENDLRGYLIENNGNKVHYQATIIFNDKTYAISFFNKNELYFDYDKTLEIISSIYSI